MTLEIDHNEFLNPDGFGNGLSVPPGAYELRQALQVLLTTGLNHLESSAQAFSDPNQRNPAALSFMINGQRVNQPLTEDPDVALVWEAISDHLYTEGLVEFNEEGQPELDQNHLQTLVHELPVILDEMTEDDEGGGDSTGGDVGNDDGGDEGS